MNRARKWQESEQKCLTSSLTNVMRMVKREGHIEGMENRDIHRFWRETLR
jgi:hypothetical protein